jgi:peptidoglycan hydrolase CwlO-like protein
MSVFANTRARSCVLAALLLAALCALAVLGDRAPAQSTVEELQGVQSKQGGIASAIERSNAEIDQLMAREAEVREQEAAVTEELSATQARLDEATAEVEQEREHLEAVKDRLGRAKEMLRRTLVELYKSGTPDTLSVILESASWSDVIAQSEYFDQIQGYDENVIARVQTLAAEVEDTVARLQAAREQIEKERDQIAAQRDEIAAARGAIESRHADLVAVRAERRQALNQLEGREDKLQKQLAPSTTAPDSPVAPPGGSTASLVDGQAVAPANAPAAVVSAIEAANRIAGLPYVWGGGHGSFEASGYDCSGAVSYALHGGGWLSSPLDSTGLTTWGAPGAGNWMTVYAHSGHTYAVIAGLRWDTSGTGGSGPSWSTAMRSSAGYVARHPSGY